MILHYSSMNYDSMCSACLHVSLRERDSCDSYCRRVDESGYDSQGSMFLR